MRTKSEGQRRRAQINDEEAEIDDREAEIDEEQDRRRADIVRLRGESETMILES